MDLLLVETPVALVDLARVRSNARRVVDYAGGHGLLWRPHVKTHKSTHIARIQLESGARGLTVATPREAEVMATVCDDLLLAHPPVGAARMARILALPPEVRLTVALDDRGALDAFAAAAAQVDRKVGVLLEVDMGMGRVGVSSLDVLVALAERCAALSHVDYRGILFYPGHLRDPGPAGEEGFQLLRRRLAELLEALERAGLPPSVVSGGSTPLLWRSHELEGLTEIRPGTTIFNDREALAAGVAGADDLAYTVLATVVSAPSPGRVVVDAGSKALSREGFRGPGGGFGALLEPAGVLVGRLSEEHGILDLGLVDWTPRVGDRVRIVPNHVCVSVNLQDHLVAMDGERVESWPVEGRGRLPFVPETGHK